MVNPTSIVYYFLAVALSPLLLGIITRVKAFFAGRQGQPVLQYYFDILKLFGKGAVFSTTTTWILRASGVIVFSALLAAMLFVPFGRRPAVLSFPGDAVLVIYLLGLARFFTVLAALDTGSSFEGMGASREVQFAVFAEPALFVGLAALIHLTQSLSLSGMYARISVESWSAAAPVLLLVAGTFLIVALAENSRIPVDDPATHLELTMVHEVMVLDHGGVDLGLMLYASALKFWLFGFLLAGLIVPARTAVESPHLDAIFFCGAMFVFAVLVGIIESIMARLRLVRIPAFLIAALSLSVLALVVQMR